MAKGKDGSGAAEALHKSANTLAAESTRLRSEARRRRLRETQRDCLNEAAGILDGLAEALRELAQDIGPSGG